ncbi:MAG TPA: TorF family putative porin, partial [Geothrix sp.]
YDNLGAYKNPNTTEAYLGLSYAWASLKYSQVISANTFGVTNSGGTNYVDLSLAYPLGESGWTILAHGGRTTYATKANPVYFFNGTTITGDNSLFSYSDYKLGVSKDLKGYLCTLAGTRADTKARAADHNVTVDENVFGRNIGGNRLTFTISKSF